MTLFFVCELKWGERTSSLVSLPFLIRALIPSWGPHPHDLFNPSHLPKVPPPNTITSGFRATTYKFYRAAGTQTLVHNNSGCTMKLLTYLKVNPVTIPFHIWSIIWEFEEKCEMWNVRVCRFCLLSSRGWMRSEAKWKSLSHVQLLVTLWTMQFMGFSRPEYWSG